MERKKTLGEIHITDRKKTNLNLSNKIINKTLKTRQHDLKTPQDRKGKKITIFIP